MKAEEGNELSYDELRQRSSQVIGPEHVVTLDERIIASVLARRGTTNIIIDSHAVTRESYGFRAIPFSASQIQRLSLDAIISLRCDPQIIVSRIAADPAGRRDVTIELAREHQTLQGSVAVNYAILCGCPIYIVDTTLLDHKGVFVEASKILNGFGMRPISQAIT